MNKIRGILFFLLIFVCANIIAGPIEQARKTPSTPWPEKKEFLDRIVKNKPEVVLIGNSMLGHGVDSNQLSEILGCKVEKFSRGGSASAWWYLVFKNIVIKTETRPQVVVFFFRDSFLTRSKYRTYGKYEESIEGMADIDEPLLDRLVFQKSGIAGYLDKLPLYQKRSYLKKKIDYIIKDILTVKLTNTAIGGTQGSISRTFDHPKLDPVQLNLEQIKAETVKTTTKPSKFEDQLKASFLPDIVNKALGNNIQLVFVRIKRKRDLSSDDEPEIFKRYVGELEEYLTQNQIPLLDFTHDNRITKSHYGVGDHLEGKHGKPLFTELLGQALKPILDQKVVL